MRDEACLRIRGLMPERLIERARELGVTFQSIQPQGDHEIVVVVSARDAVKMQALCRRFSIPCAVISLRGKGAIVRAVRRRWTLVPGLMILLCVCWFFLGHIWRIDVVFVGDSASLGDSSAVYNVLESMGISPGVSRALDTRQLSRELPARLDDIGFALARIEGVRLLIEVAPEAATPQIYDVDAARDLYADRSGIVISVNVEAGVPCVKPGDAVHRGQRVIRGEERSSKEENRGIAALGEVVIRAWFDGEAEGSTRVNQTEYTGQASSSSTLITPWFSFPIVKGESYDQQVLITDVVPVGGLYLPVRIERVERRQTRVREAQMDRAALIRDLSALALAQAHGKLTAEGPAQCTIARTWTRVNETDDGLRVRAVCEIHANTAVTAEALGG